MVNHLTEVVFVMGVIGVLNLVALAIFVKKRYLPLLIYSCINGLFGVALIFYSPNVAKCLTWLDQNLIQWTGSGLIIGLILGNVLEFYSIARKAWA